MQVSMLKQQDPELSLGLIEVGALESQSLLGAAPTMKGGPFNAHVVEVRVMATNTVGKSSRRDTYRVPRSLGSGGCFAGEPCCDLLGIHCWESAWLVKLLCGTCLQAGRIWPHGSTLEPFFLCVFPGGEPGRLELLDQLDQKRWPVLQALPPPLHAKSRDYKALASCS